MPKLTQEQFVDIVKAVAAARGKVKSIDIGKYSVVANIASRSGKMVYQWTFMFDEATGDYKYYGAFATANEPVFFADAIRSAIKGLTGK